MISQISYFKPCPDPQKNMEKETEAAEGLIWTLIILSFQF